MFFRAHWLPVQLGSALLKYGSFQQDAHCKEEIPRAASAEAFVFSVMVGTKFTLPCVYNENDPFMRYGNAQPRSGSARWRGEAAPTKECTIIAKRYCSGEEVIAWFEEIKAVIELRRRFNASNKEPINNTSNDSSSSAVRGRSGSEGDDDADDEDGMSGHKWCY